MTAYARGKRTIGWREIGEAMRDLRRQVTWGPSRLRRFATLAAAALAGGTLALGVLAVARGGQLPWFDRLTPREDAPRRTEVPMAPTPRAAAPTSLPVEASAPVATGTSAETAAPSPATTVFGSGGGPSVAPEASALGAAAEAPTAMRATATPLPETTPSVAPTGTPGIMETASQASDVTIRVSAGDTLTDLAMRYYGNASARVLATIRAANPWLDDPNVIMVGRTLVLPAPRSTDAAVPKVADDSFP